MKDFRCVAREVVAAELRLPSKAGELDTLALLPEQHRVKFWQARHRVLPPDEAPQQVPAPCYMVAPSEEAVLRRRLLDTCMAIVVEESFLALRPVGRILLKGFFAVDHKKGLRAIVDCRAANVGESRVKMCTLPNGPMFVHLRLSMAEGLRGSGDDLSNWFYQLQESPELLSRRGFGRCITGQDAIDLGLDGARRYRMVLRVLGMGTANAPDIAQAAHEEALRRGGCLAPGTVLEYGSPLPAGPILEGIYLDDHLVVYRCARSDLRSSVGPDRDLIQASHLAYEHNHIDRSTDKAFGFSHVSDNPKADTTFRAWGTEVDGVRGTVRAPPEKCLEVAALIQAALANTWTQKEFITRILGLLVHPLMHCRPLAASLGDVYQWHANLGDGVKVRWPAQVRQQLFCASLMLLVAETRLRDPVSPVVSATDATPTSGAVVRALVSPVVAGFLYDYGEHRGEHTRLDWGPDHEAIHPSRMMAPTDFTRELLGCLDWTVARSQALPTVHVNIREMAEVIGELHARADQSLLPERVPNFSDSRVVIGAYAKGRSSSIQLNASLRAGIGPVLLAGKSAVNTWCCSGDNVADDPSRFVPLRPPTENTPLGSHACRPVCPGIAHVIAVLRGSPGRSHWLDVELGPDGGREVFSYLWSEADRRFRPGWGREVFAGAGGLTRALRKVGLVCRAPMEAYPTNHKYIAQHDLDRTDVFVALLREVASGQYRFLHFGVPCGQWSALARLNGTSRTLSNPDGPRPHTFKMAVSHSQADRVAALCLAQHCTGGLFCIENPRDSLIFRSSPLVALAGCLVIHEATFDQCQYGLQPPAPKFGEYIKKATKVWANFGEVASMSRTCPGQSESHSHVHALGTRTVETPTGPRSISVAMLAGRYPDPLCSCLADAVMAALRRQGHRP